MKLTGAFVAAFAMLAFRGLTAAEHRLDLRGNAARPKLMRTLSSAAAVPEVGVLRQTHLASGAAVLPPLAVGDALVLELFDDVERTVVLKERLESPVGGDAFIATVEGGNGLVSAAVVQTENGVLVNLQDVGKGRVYTVVSSAEATLVRELDPKAGKVTPCRSHELALSSGAVEIAAPQLLASSAPSGEQSSTVVDILVAYDTGATAWAKANGGGLASFALMAVTKMNEALANNQIDEQFRFRLVGTMELAATSSDVEEALDAIRDDKAGWSAIRAKRDEVGADIVTVLVDTGYAFGTTGVGRSLVNENYTSFADSAYNVCAVRAVAIDHTMTHEVGHNMGAGHASNVNPATIEPGPQLHVYSSGFHFTADGTAYHTIMAYNFDGWGNSYELAPLFSSPTATWLGVTAGDATHDNARTLLSTCAYASNWRAQKVPLSYDVFFSPGADMLFDEAVMVTLTPGKAGLDIRYTTDGSEPTLTSEHYFGPLLLKETTTVKAAAVYDGRLGPVFTARYLKRDLATALNVPQFVWTTSPDSPWVAQTEYAFDGFAVQSCPEFVGDFGCRKTSWLKATVTGKGKFVFTYKGCTWGNKNSVTYSLNGTVQKTIKGSCTSGAQGETVTQVIDTDGTTTFAWTYDVAEPNWDYTSDYSYGGIDIWCGVWLSDVQWIPEAEPTPAVTPNGVEYSWLDEKFPTGGVRTPEQYAALENEDADGDGYLNWQEYLCGTDPNSAGAGADAVPRCTIEIVDGVPKIDHNIRIPDAAKAEGWRVVTKGSVDLKNWVDANVSVHRFFKVVVEKN